MRFDKLDVMRVSRSDQAGAFLAGQPAFFGCWLLRTLDGWRVWYQATIRRPCHDGAKVS